MARIVDRPTQYIRVRRSRIQGRGVFAIQRIRKGQRIIEYVGERIHPDEEDRRYQGTRKRHHTFLFGIDKDVTIDATRRGNISKYINHSCDPNCEAVNEDGRIFIEAMKNIQAGTELCYDYNFEVDGRHTKELLQYYACRCNAPNCRRTILKPQKKKRKRKKTARR